MALHGRRVSALTEPLYETVSELAPIAVGRYPHLKSFAVAGDVAEAERFRELGLEAVVNRSVPPGLDLAAAVLHELGLEATSIETWMRQQQERVLASNVRPLAA
jgi:hypothetical protein